MYFNRVKRSADGRVNHYWVGNRATAKGVSLDAAEKGELRNLIFAGTERFGYEALDVAIWDDRYEALIKVHPRFGQAQGLRRVPLPERLSTPNGHLQIS